MADNNADGVSRDEIDWDSINWQYHEDVVRRLQERIVKAVQSGNRDKTHDLQRLLTRSRSGKLLAIKRVTENDGSKTPGVDKMTWEHRRSKEMAVTLLNRRRYTPQPLRRIYIPKSNGKMRPLGIPTMLDRAKQALHLLALDPIAETTADSQSYGFRIGRSCADAIKQCFLLLSGGRDRWILEGDIKGCFDHISHKWLLEHVPMEQPLLRKWLECGYMEKDVFAATREGTPQGGIISPVLANLTLDGLESLLRKHFPIQGPLAAIGREARVKLVRYADDFVITGSSKELLETQVRPLVAEFLRERGLELSLEKTKITHLRDGFDFLGQNVRSFGDKTIIQPSKKNIATFLDKIRKIVKNKATVTAADLVRILNPRILGWANYHKHVCSKRTFSEIDNQIKHCLLVWAARRHKNDGKSRRWIVDKYFGSQGNRCWWFFGDDITTKGERKRYWLAHAASTPIRRHTKVLSDAHPYASEWKEYWRKRKSNGQPVPTALGRGHALDYTVRPPRPNWGV
jgi:RNA-directed DNA polymerase